MINDIEATVIISFYNKMDWLKLVLAGFERQSYKAFEIIIADDGSEKSVVDQIHDYIQHSILRILHIWHEDKGWRKTEILNKAIVKSCSDYLIFIDGDCIPHSQFVKEHIRNRQLYSTLAGRRVNLSKAITGSLTPEKVLHGYLEKRLILKMAMEKVFKKQGSHIENALYFKSRIIRNKINKKKKGILGSNFSLHKKDLLAVNGFDERYRAPAVGEDSDLRFRLELNGVKIIPVKHIAIQYHLYHEKRSRESDNMKIFEEVKAQKITFTPYGIEKKDKQI